MGWIKRVRAPEPRRLAVLAACLVPMACGAQAFAEGRCRLSNAGLAGVHANPHGIAAADLTADGRADLAVANQGGNTVSLLRSVGDGSFTLIQHLMVGASPSDVALADVNGDGRPDVLVAASGANALEVRLRLQGGDFASGIFLAAGVDPRSLAVADFNQDGKPDVAVAASGSNEVSVFAGNGDGTFAARIAYSVGGNPSGVAAADLNGDAKPDLAVSNEASDTVSVLVNAGNGSFGAATSYAVGDQPRDVASADVTGDGKPDLLVANWNGAGISVLAGNGNGSFAAAATHPTEALPTALMTVDLDGDATLDVVVAHEMSFPNVISVLQGLPGGGLASASALPVEGTRPRAIAAGDFDGDGQPDVAVAAYASNQVAVLLSRCAPVMNLSPRSDVDIGSSYQLRKSPLWVDRTHEGHFTHVTTHQDLDRDGDTDLVRASLVHFVDTPVEVLVNSGGNFSDQTAQSIPVTPPPMRYPRKGLNGDFNDDGWPDVALLDTGDDAPPFPGDDSHLYLSNGDGTLHYSAALAPYVGYTHGGASADVDGNGTVDILMIEGMVRPYLLLNDGTGQFTADTLRLPQELLRSAYWTGEMLDIDLDGYVDIIASGNEFDQDNPGVTIWWGGASGLYRKSASTVIPKPVGNGGVLDFAAEDIDHDGDRDLVIYRFPDNFATNERYFQVLPQVAPRQFADQTASRVTMKHDEPAFDYIRVQDINGDGHVDIFADDRSFESIGDYAWTNNGSGVFAPYAGPVNPALPYTSIDIADVSTVEGHAGTKQLVFEVRLNRPATAPVTFDMATGSGTATAGADFVAKSSNGVVIGTGQSSASFAVSINGDVLAEADEMFTVTLSAVSGAKVLRGRAYGMIGNDDVYALAVGDASVTEGHAGQTQADFIVSLSPAAPEPVQFDIRTEPGTASPGVDYITTTQAGRTIPAGQTSAVFSVPVLGDTAVESHESFTVNLSNPVGAVVLDGQGRGRIVNDDLAQLSIADASIVEGASGQATLTFIVSLSRAMPNPVYFDIATAGGSATAGSDFIARSLPGRFLDAGRTQWRFDVQVNGDAQAESNETFAVTLSNVNGAVLGDGAAVGTILNDDGAAVGSQRVNRTRAAKPGAAPRGVAR